MAYLGETLLLIEKRNAANMELYVVVSDTKTEGEEVTFLKQDDAFEFARNLLNGGKEVVRKKVILGSYKDNRGGKKPSYPVEVTRKRREFILDHFKNSDTVESLIKAARAHKDKDISSIPKGSLSGITSHLCRKKKLSMIHKIGHAGVYKTVTRG